MPLFHRTGRSSKGIAIIACGIFAISQIAAADCVAPTHYNDIQATVLSCRVQRFDNNELLTWFEFIIGHFRHRYDGTILTVRVESNSGKITTETLRVPTSVRLWEPGTQRDVLWLEGKGCNDYIPARLHLVEVIPCCDVLPHKGECLVRKVPHVSSVVSAAS
jgi:hypothetical protein